MTTEQGIPAEFDHLADAYKVPRGRERADALRWFMLGRKSADDVPPPAPPSSNRVNLRDLLTEFGQAYMKLWNEGSMHNDRVEAAEAAINEAFRRAMRRGWRVDGVSELRAGVGSAPCSDRRSGALNEKLMQQAIRWGLPRNARHELEVAHELLDVVMVAHPEVTVERLGPTWNAYPWFGPAGEEHYELYRGMSFVDAVVACAEKGSPQQR